MGLEAATYIDELVNTNPVGGTDNVSQGDDHLRLIKAVLLNSFPNISGAVSKSDTAINALPDVGDNETIAGTWDFTGDPTIDSVQIGYKILPTTVDDDAHGFVLTENGCLIVKESGAAATWTIPANASVAFPVGSCITLINRDDSDITLAITSDTLVQALTGSTGSRTIAQYGVATIVKVASTVWYVTGVGVT